MIPRCAGLLVHPTSLPGPYGIGDLGPGADAFLEWAAAAGQGVWQILPLGPTGHGNSPYGALSAFAGNPLLISPERLVEDGLLPSGTLSGAPRFPPDRVDFEALAPWKERLLRRSWEFFRHAAAPKTRQELEEFFAGPEQADWLDDWALYMALKMKHGGREWTTWDPPLVRREPRALAAARRELAEEMAYHEYVQFLFFRQWAHVKALARRRGIRILGDIPFYVATDSADAWAHERLFTFDENGCLETVAGVPPDYFSATGQLWGNPLYRWDRIEAEGFAWWIERLRANLRLADLLRLDHFRGFAAYWEIPASAPSAAAGWWVKGPGATLFTAIRRAIGDLPLVAEDLGHITPDVIALRDEFGLPGMKVLQFAFVEPDSEYLPHKHPVEAVVYTGTHDNDTTRGWFDSLGEEERGRVLEYLETDGEEIEWSLIRAAYHSKAELAVIPIQDVFSLGSEARMNTPGPTTGNWNWRARADEFTPQRAERLRALAEDTRRFHRR